MRLLGVIGIVALVGASACTDVAFTAPSGNVTVVDCETGYSEALARGGKSQSQIEAAFDQCLGRAIQASGPDGDKQVFVIRQSAQTVQVTGDGKGGYIGTPRSRVSRPNYGCPPGFRGMYRGTLYCPG